MRILLFGKQGQLGWELHRSLQSLGHITALDYPEIDFRALDALEKTVLKVKPQIIVNAAAYTDVDRAEGERDQAFLINAEAPALLARISRALDSVLIHYSTDYVFDGQKGAPYVEEDRPNPLNVYGQSKWEGERGVAAAGGVCLIMRTAWIYSTRSNSFVAKVLRWSRTQKLMSIVDDQVSNPTWARILAETTAGIIAHAGSEPLPWLKDHSGLYHVAMRGYASRLEWAKAILENDSHAGERTIESILPARSSDFPTPASRPKFSALDCGRVQRVFGIHLPDWRTALKLAMDS